VAPSGVYADAKPLRDVCDAETIDNQCSHFDFTTTESESCPQRFRVERLRSGAPRDDKDGSAWA